MRLTWVLGALLGLALVLTALPATMPTADAQLGQRHFLPNVPRDATPTPTPPPTATPTPQATPTPSGLRIRYRAWSGGGWLPWQEENGIAGVTGQSRPIEA